MKEQREHKYAKAAADDDGYVEIDYEDYNDDDDDELVLDDDGSEVSYYSEFEDGEDSVLPPYLYNELLLASASPVDDTSPSGSTAVF